MQSTFTHLGEYVNKNRLYVKCGVCLSSSGAKDAVCSLAVFPMLPVRAPSGPVLAFNPCGPPSQGPEVMECVV